MSVNPTPIRQPAADRLLRQRAHNRGAFECHHGIAAQRRARPFCLLCAHSCEHGLMRGAAGRVHAAQFPDVPAAQGPQACARARTVPEGGDANHGCGHGAVHGCDEGAPGLRLCCGARFVRPAVVRWSAQALSTRPAPQNGCAHGRRDGESCKASARVAPDPMARVPAQYSSLLRGVMDVVTRVPALCRSRAIRVKTTHDYLRPPACGERAHAGGARASGIARR